MNRNLSQWRRWKLPASGKKVWFCRRSKHAEGLWSPWKALDLFFPPHSQTFPSRDSEKPQKTSGCDQKPASLQRNVSAPLIGHSSRRLHLKELTFKSGEMRNPKPGEIRPHPVSVFPVLLPPACLWAAALGGRDCSKRSCSAVQSYQPRRIIFSGSQGNIRREAWQTDCWLRLLLMLSGTEPGRNRRTLAPRPFENI